jgi:hypothetical protein
MFLIHNLKRFVGAGRRRWLFPECLVCPISLTPPLKFFLKVFNRPIPFCGIYLLLLLLLRKKLGQANQQFVEVVW